MSGKLNRARAFFDACETGKGWGICRAHCDPKATFSAQSDVLSEIDTLEEYCEWMRNLFTPVPDGRYELRFMAEDENRGCVAAVAVLHGTQTGPGGPGDPTERTIAADYVYLMEFDGEWIKHMTKIWNDAVSLKQLGWA